LQKFHEQCGHADFDQKPKHIVEHIVDQVWDQYEEAKNQPVEEDLARNFILMCLDIHEQTLAKEIGR